MEFTDRRVDLQPRVFTCMGGRETMKRNIFSWIPNKEDNTERLEWHFFLSLNLGIKNCRENSFRQEMKEQLS